MQEDKWWEKRALYFWQYVNTTGPKFKEFVKGIADEAFSRGKAEGLETVRQFIKKIDRASDYYYNYNGDILDHLDKLIQEAKKN